MLQRFRGTANHLPKVASSSYLTRICLFGAPVGGHQYWNLMVLFGLVACLAVLMYHWLVMDGRTWGQNDTDPLLYNSASIASCAKICICKDDRSWHKK